MATQLFLLSTAASTHRATNTAKINGSTSGWTPRALGLTRGSGVTATGNVATVNGTTTGLEVTDGTFPYEWISEPVAADVTISGTITANIWAAESSMTANVAIDVLIDIVRSDSSNTIVQIVKSSFATELALTTRAANNFTTGMTSGGYTGQTLNRGDRLRIRVFGIDGGGTMVTGFTFNAGFAGTTAAADGDSYVTFAENITFEAAPGAEAALVTQNTQTGSVTESVGSGAATTKVAQSFTALGSTTRVELGLSKTGTPTDNVVVELQSDSGGSPSGTVLASDSRAMTTLTTSNAFYSFALLYATVSSTTYWIVVSRSGALAAGSNPEWALATSDVYAGGQEKVFDGSSWSSPGARDLQFRVYGPTATGSVIYLTDTASDVATASVDREAWTSRGAGVQNDVTNTAAGFTSPIQVTDTAGGTVVDWFTKQLQAVTLGGMAQMNMRALESNASANASIRVEVARVATDGTSPTVWASWNMSANNTRTGELNTSETAETVNVSGDDLAITDGQRLRIRLYIDDMPTTAMGASQTVTTYYAGTSAAASGDTYITFPVTFTEYVPAGPATEIPVGFAVGRDY